MDELENNEIARLLRLKRYEQPPPGYFEDFLHEFHRRQRDELLRQPIWSVVWQRFSGSLFRLNIPSLTSYPAAVAAVLVCAAVVSLKIYEAPSTPSFASSTPAFTSAGEVVAALPDSTVPVNDFTLNSPMTLANRNLGLELSRQIDRRAHTHRATAPPRYVLDHLPVSYEPSFNF